MFVSKHEPWELPAPRCSRRETEEGGAVGRGVRWRQESVPRGPCGHAKCRTWSLLNADSRMGVREEVTGSLK